MKVNILCILLSLVFLASGSAKLASLAFEIAAFERWGYPLWFMYFTGLVEVAGGIGLLIRPVSALASGGLTVVMLGAVATHVMHAEWGMLVAASTILMLAAVRTWWGRDEIRALLSCRSC
jgi:uncharacterized membrane protein YphA (DoxX/SURF4 family)